MGTPFLFDAPGSTDIAALWTLFWGAIGLPVVILVTIVVLARVGPAKVYQPISFADIGKVLRGSAARP